MSSYSRQDVLRILQISARQLQGWERAALIDPQQTYTFQDLGQLRILRALREDDVPAASIRHSISAMKAVAGMSNPLLEATVVRTGNTRIAFRHLGAMAEPAPLRPRGVDAQRNQQEQFLAAVQAEEAGERQRAIQLYGQIIAADPSYAAAFINLGTIYFHLRQYGHAEELYRRATEADPDYVLAFFDLGNVLDELDRPEESIAAYEQAVALAPRYGDAHYNLALAYERKGDLRHALRHWHAYVKLDRTGPWADHARGQIHKLLSREKLAIAWRAQKYVAPGSGKTALRLAESRDTE